MLEIPKMILENNKDVRHVVIHFVQDTRYSQASALNSVAMRQSLGHVFIESSPSDRIQRRGKKQQLTAKKHTNLRSDIQQKKTQLYLI